MKTRTVLWALAAATLLNMASVASAAAPVIGTVTAKGAFRVDNSTVTGNATLFEGSTVETASVVSSLLLQGRARISLAAGSKGKFFGDRMILEKGEAKLEQGATFRFEARGLTIQPGTGTAQARMALAGNTKVRVASLSGAFRVLNSRGVLVANLASGAALEFDPQQPSGPTKLTGCLQNKSGHFLLTDETTQVTVELTGPGLDKEVGNRVAVAGGMDAAATPVSDASQFIRVTEVKQVAKGCAAGKTSTAAAGKGGSGGGAPAGGAAGGTAGGIGISTATIAVIGGVAVAATVGGLAAGGLLPGQGSSPISR